MKDGSEKQEAADAQWEEVERKPRPKIIRLADRMRAIDPARSVEEQFDALDALAKAFARGDR